jgi:hypothetical protein
MPVLKPYFDTEGPFGLPMKDRQARALEARVKALPKDEAFALRRCTFERGLTEVQPGDRTDVSWITEEAPDRAGDVVLAGGMNDEHFRLNPIVTLNHCYTQPPVGRSLWRRKVREGALHGIKAKTVYPPRPDAWAAGEWPPDVAFELVRAGLLRGKSIGFLPLKVRAPTAEEIGRRPELANVRYVIEEWLLAEYACCFLPMQPHAVVEQVSKSLPQLPHALAAALDLPARPLPFTSLDEVGRAVARLLRSPAFDGLLQNSLQRSWQKARGIV